MLKVASVNDFSDHFFKFIFLKMLINSDFVPYSFQIPISKIDSEHIIRFIMWEIVKLIKHSNQECTIT